jgi:hypothetical protein
MQIFSWIVLAIIAYIAIVSRTSKERFIKILILNIVISTHFESGYFISLGGFELDYDQIISLFTAVFGVMACHLKFNKKLLANLCFFYGSLLVGVIGLIVFPYGEKIVTGSSNNYDEVIAGTTSLQYASFDTGTISGLLFFAVFSVITVCAWNVLNKEDLKRIIIRTAFYYKIILIYGLVETVLVYGLHTDIHRSVINTVMGQGAATFNSLITRGSGYMLEGLTREASHYMFSLFITMIVICTEGYFTRKKQFFWTSVIFFIALMSFSLSSVLYILGIIGYSMLIMIRNDPVSARKKISKVIAILVMTFITAIILILAVWIIYINGSENYLILRLGESIESVMILFKGSSMSIFAMSSYRTSSMIRLYSVIETLKLFIHRPLFGFGIGVLTCHGSTAMFLGDVGIIGCYSWYKMVTSTNYDIKQFSVMGNQLFKWSIALYIVINILSSRYLVPYENVVVLIYIICAEVNFHEEKAEAIMK